ncbi:hypothetical protein HPP92_027961 [Vanilla planifolia]|uniref:Agenet domain-containing protein n=1 Tax=Vanilla planifolia TaxID=51239 RepID=A0A835U540_VANPL|nr:hypothetical protein HPP92_027961 [Vanilla planifolia]
MEFKAGDEVEVSSKDVGYGGQAWYEAKVVRPMTRLGRYTVVYDNIFKEADASKTLRDTVETAHIRPRRPPETDWAFSLHQLVDALYNGGWWVGVVSGISSTGITVTFLATGDIVEFLSPQLRAHLDWVNGEWVVPIMPDMVRTLFGMGTLVEVCSNDEVFHGAWIPARIIQFFKSKFLVEYRDLTSEDGTEPLREVVDYPFIRPSPPETAVFERFKNLEEVDAYYNDVWWIGVISKVLEGSRYIVYFRTWKQEIEFAHKDLRLHHDWISGKWVQASRLSIGLMLFHASCLNYFTYLLETHPSKYAHSNSFHFIPCGFQIMFLLYGPAFFDLLAIR